MEHHDDSDAESFKSTQEDSKHDSKENAAATTTTAEIHRYSPEEEKKLLAESDSQKESGNGLFGKGSYENAIQTYDRALASCPNYLDYEIAALRANIAACHLKLEEWKEAVESASKAIECLERLEPLPTISEGAKPEASAVLELDDGQAERIEKLEQSGHTIQQVRSLQVKCLIRRGKAKSSMSGWADLQGAAEDYDVLLSSEMVAFVRTTDKTTTLAARKALAPRLAAARDNEVADMMGKLKGLGNSLLKPFGMSTDNFQFVKDEKSGGYSMNFNQNPGK